MDATNYDLTDLYYVGTHCYSFRTGEPGRVIGARELPGGRLCYVVEYVDGQQDLAAMCDGLNYRLVSGEDVRAGRLPKGSE